MSASWEDLATWLKWLPGYAQFLIQKLAVNATPGILKQVERRREQERSSH